MFLFVIVQIVINKLLWTVVDIGKSVEDQTATSTRASDSTNWITQGSWSGEGRRDAQKEGTRWREVRVEINVIQKHQLWKISLLWRVKDD